MDSPAYYGCDGAGLEGVDEGVDAVSHIGRAAISSLPQGAAIHSGIKTDLIEMVSNGFHVI